MLRPLTILPVHPNGMTITAYDEDGGEILRETYFSSVAGSSSLRPKAAERQPHRCR